MCCNIIRHTSTPAFESPLTMRHPLQVTEFDVSQASPCLLPGSDSGITLHTKHWPNSTKLNTIVLQAHRSKTSLSPIPERANTLSANKESERQTSRHHGTQSHPQYTHPNSKTSIRLNVSATRPRKLTELTLNGPPTSPRPNTSPPSTRFNRRNF